MFRKGDVVRCADDEGTSGLLQKDQDYTVSGLGPGDNIHLEGSRLSWLAGRFDLVPPPPISTRPAVVKETYVPGTYAFSTPQAATGATLGTGLDKVAAGIRAGLTISTVLPTDSGERKHIPITTGCLDYFPAAIAAVASLSYIGNEKHNPGEPLHHARGKSQDHADCIVRHLLERGTVDTDGIRHSVKVAWRALALLQEELEAAGAAMARGAKP